MEQINPDLIPVIEEMLYEFIESKPETYLVPSRHEDCAKDGGMIRAAMVRNPEWYRNMCADFIRPPKIKRRLKKHPRTRVKRKHTIAVIELIIKNGGSTSKYAPYIIEEAKRRYAILERCIAPQFDEWNNQF